jgi:hypothetical protein
MSFHFKTVLFQNCGLEEILYSQTRPKKYYLVITTRSGVVHLTSNMKNNNQLVSNLWPLHSNDSSSDTRGSSRGGLEEKQGIEK